MTLHGEAQYIPIPTHGYRHSLLPGRRPRPSHNATTYVRFPTQNFQTFAIFRLCAAQCSTSERRAPLRAVRSSSVPSLLRMSGVVPCTEHRKRVLMRHEKSTDQTVQRPTKRSKTFSPTSLSPCGARTLRHLSQPSSVAVCARSSATWKDRANGPARPSQRSFRKSFNGIECATSA